MALFQAGSVQGSGSKPRPVLRHLPRLHVRQRDGRLHHLRQGQAREKPAPGQARRVRVFGPEDQQAGQITRLDLSQHSAAQHIRQDLSETELVNSKLFLYLAKI